MNRLWHYPVAVVLRSPIHANEPSEYNGMLYRTSNRVLNNGIKVIILICMDGTSQYHHHPLSNENNLHNQWTTIDQSIFISCYTVRLSNCQSLHLDEDKQNGYHWVRKFRAERQESPWEVVFLYGRQPKNILISWRERRGWNQRYLHNVLLCIC